LPSMRPRPAQSRSPNVNSSQNNSRKIFSAITVPPPPPLKLFSS
jgi:hypothetical protein